MLLFILRGTLGRKENSKVFSGGGGCEDLKSTRRRRPRSEDNFKISLEGIAGGRELVCGARQGQLASFCEHGDELPSSVKFQELFDWLRNCGLRKKHYATWL